MAVFGVAGIIPTTVGALTKLELLGLHQNQLTGESCFSLMSLALWWFIYLVPWVGNNLRRSAFICHRVIYCVKQLYFLFLCCAGRIPTEVGVLRNLEALWLNDNKLCGESSVCTSMVSYDYT